MEKYQKFYCDENNRSYFKESKRKPKGAFASYILRGRQKEQQ